MKFTKMHGTGNDYVYVNLFEENVGDVDARSELSKKVSDRHFGIGSDGLILIGPSETADFMMDIYNADGSRAMMCGNGIRCVGKYVYDNGLTDKTEVSVETASGIKYLKLHTENGKVDTVRVDMGEPVLEPCDIPVISQKSPVVDEDIMVNTEHLKMTCVSMGNPHAVFFVDDTDNFPIEKYGPFIENASLFPERVNAEFVKVKDKHNISMRVWERGSAETMSCGTGACASVVACILNKLTDRTVTVSILGGELVINWNENDGHVYMTGPAVTVFEGEISD